jgi:hypothetical protein
MDLNNLWASIFFAILSFVWYKTGKGWVREKRRQEGIDYKYTQSKMTFRHIAILIIFILLSVNFLFISLFEF